MSTGGVNLQSWRDQMAITARNSATEHRVCFGEPVLVQANFRFAMPKSRPKWMRDQGTECRAANIDQPVGIYAGMSAKARRDIRREGQVA